MRMQTRGAGEVARSLNVRGEEIYDISGVTGINHGDCAYLVGSIADANVEVWQIRLDHVP